MKNGKKVFCTENLGSSEVMKDIPDKSIDMILCDLPYGLTQNLYDINLNKGEAINKSRHLNYIRWDDNATTLITEIDDVAKWIKERIEWIDTQLESDIVGIKHTISYDESATTTIYDLYGRKIDDIENLQKGIYIINGKKVIIK